MSIRCHFQFSVASGRMCFGCVHKSTKRIRRVVSWYAMALALVSLTVLSSGDVVSFSLYFHCLSSLFVSLSLLLFSVHEIVLRGLRDCGPHVGGLWLSVEEPLKNGLIFSQLSRDRFAIGWPCNRGRLITDLPENAPFLFFVPRLLVSHKIMNGHQWPLRAI